MEKRDGTEIQFEKARDGFSDGPLNKNNGTGGKTPVPLFIGRFRDFGGCGFSVCRRNRDQRSLLRRPGQTDSSAGIPAAASLQGRAFLSAEGCPADVLWKEPGL